MVRLVALLGLAGLLGIGAWQAADTWRVAVSEPRLPLWDMAGHGFQAVQLAVDLAAARPLDFLVHLNAQDKWPFGFSLLLLPFVWAGGASFAAAAVPSLLLYAAMPALLAWALAEAAGAGAPGDCRCVAGKGLGGVPAEVAVSGPPVPRASAPPTSGGSADGALWDGMDPPASGFASAAARWTFAGGVGAALGLAFLLAPLPRLFSLLVMREMAGIAVVTVALAATLRARRLELAVSEPAKRTAAWRWSAAASLTLLLMKVNFGVLWLGSLLLWRLVESTAGERRSWVAGGWSVVWPRDGGWPRRLLAGALWLLALATALGENPGIGLYAVQIALTVAGVLAWRRRRAELERTWSTLSTPLRAYLAVLVAPLWIWWLSPDPIHPKEIFAFLRNRPGAPFSWEGLLLAYPQSWLADWSPSPAVGVAVVALAAVAALLGWRRSAGVQLVLCGLAVHVALIALHSYRQPRFFATAVPFLLVAGGLGVLALGMGLGAAWTRRRADGGGLTVRPRSAPTGREEGPGVVAADAGSLQRAGASLALALALALLLAGGLLGTSLPGTASGREARLRADWRAHSGDPALAGLLELARRKAPTTGRLGVIGGFNEMSPSLVKWALCQGGARTLRFADEIGYPGRRRYQADGSLLGLESAAAAAAIDEWLEDERPSALAVIQVDRRSDFAADADFRRYNAWQQDLVPAAKGLAGWRRGGRADLPQRGLALLLLVPEVAPPGSGR